MSGGFNTGDADMDGKLDFGETWQYTASHTVTQAEMDAGGTIDNTASVTTDQGATANDSASITVDQNPSVTMAKDASVPGGTADVAGEVISYTIAVTNNGNVSLTNVAVSDPSVSDLAAVMSGSFNAGDANTDGKLSVGETWQYTASYTVTQADIDNNGGGDGTIDNTASVSTDQGASANDGASITVDQNPSVTMAKDASVPGGTADMAGEVISYTIAVTNNGNVSLTNVAVSDPSVSDLAAVMSGSFNAGDANTDGKLSVGETWQYTASYTVAQADIDNNGGGDGTIDNTASVSTDQGASANDGASVEVEQPAVAAMALDKSDAVGTMYIDSGEDGLDSDGDLIQYILVLENVGTVPISNIVLDDPLLGGTVTNLDGGDLNNNDILDVGETWVYSQNYFLTAADVTAGHVENDATATGLDPSNNVVNVMAHYDVLLPA